MIIPVSNLQCEVVACRSETEYADRPLSLIWKGLRLEIAEIQARWRSPGEKVFRVQAVNGKKFILTYLEVADEWEVRPL